MSPSEAPVGTTSQHPHSLGGAKVGGGSQNTAPWHVTGMLELVVDHVLGTPLKLFPQQVSICF